jgi:hypothetical protein
MKKTILPVLFATIWISLSEFVRNEFILKSYWMTHYENMGLVFPSAPVNGAVWGIWSLCLAIVVFILAQKFSLIQTTFIAWFVGFFLMWLVIGNMGVLPFVILPFAIPLSLLEAYIASLIIKRMSVKIK